MTHVRQELRLQPIRVLHLHALRLHLRRQRRQLIGLLTQLVVDGSQLLVPHPDFIGHPLRPRRRQQIGERRVHPELRLLQNPKVVFVVRSERRQRDDGAGPPLNRQRDGEHLPRDRRPRCRLEGKDGALGDPLHERHFARRQRLAQLALISFRVEGRRRFLRQADRGDRLKGSAVLAPHVERPQLRDGNIQERQKDPRSEILNVARRNHRFGDLAAPPLDSQL